MNITELCNSRRDALLPKWTDGFFAAYPLDGVGMLRTGADPFTNPIGATTRDSLVVLYDAVAGNDADPEAVRGALARLAELRAVQDMPPSRALGALYVLKTLLREHILPLCSLTPNKSAGDRDERLRAYMELESRVDGLALLAFDLYAAAREKVFRARVNDVKRSQAHALRWARAQSGKHGERAPFEEF